ncbi:MAG: SDR family oxidoreductase [Anaerolineae bacterium]|nr:SDR family oxidoreductase [Anaerolineae bacterium]
MKNIVITGSTRGIGYGLADAFLSLGCSVTVSGRSQSTVDKAVAALAAGYDAGRVHGHPCDVADLEQVQALWDAAQARFGHIDIWINNAGVGQPAMPFRELSPDLMRAIVETNILGTIYGSRVAFQGMMRQGGGQVYNMEGYGSDGAIRAEASLTIYGTSKCAIHYFDRSLALELKNTPVLVGWISPGMVATEMITGQYAGKPEEWERVKRIFNIIAERVDVVAPWLAERILANTKSGVRIAYDSKLRLMLRFLLAPFVKRDVFGDLMPE